MAYEIIDTNQPRARFLRDYTDIDQKREAQLRELRSREYKENGPTGYGSSDVFAWRQPFSPVSPALVIDKGILKKKTPKKLPEVCSLFDYYVFSKRVKEAVDNKGKSTNEFFSIKIYNHDQTNFHEYFAIHVGAYLDCVGLVESGYTQKFRDDGVSYWIGPSEPHQTFVYKDKIAGHHYWRDLTAGKEFFSDEAVEILGDDFLPKGLGLKQVILI